MTVDHFPGNPFGRFSNPYYGPFGFFTAALGFVFLSGLVAGWVYESRRAVYGVRSMTYLALRRARAIYVTQIILCVMLAAAVALHVRGVERWSLDMFESSAWKGLFASASLLYEPEYLGILPMYCLFLVLTPVLIWQLAKGRVRYVLAASILVWVAASLLVRLPDDPNGVNLGGFNPLSYQLLFVVGLAISTKSIDLESLVRRRSWLVPAAVMAVAVCFVARQLYAVHGPASSVVDRFGYLSSLTELGPLRVLDFAAFGLVLYVVSRRIDWTTVEFRGFRWLAFIGRGSLPVFAWSIAVTYAAGALLPFDLSRPQETLVLLAMVASLTFPAWARSRLRQRRVHPLARERRPPIRRGAPGWLLGMRRAPHEARPQVDPEPS